VTVERAARPMLKHTARIVEVADMIDECRCTCGWVSTRYFDGAEYAHAEWERHMHTAPITGFQGQWSKLSNYSVCCIFYEGHAYQSVEHAFQAQKSTDPAVQKMIRDQATPAAAKKLARSLPVRADWADVKIGVMRDLLREKFSQEPERAILLATGEAELVEGNWWNDRFWGQCPVGEGENWLGRLLMEVRTALRAGTLVAPSEAWSAKSTTSN